MSHGTFRFLDLPAEIRNNVYKIIVGQINFEDERPQMNYGRKPKRLNDARVLFTCKQIYHEAYKVMVTANQFILIEGHKVDLRRLFRLTGMPALVDAIHVDTRSRFSDFAAFVAIVSIERLVSAGDPIEVDDWGVPLEYQRPANAWPISRAMIVGRSWAKFCEILERGDRYISGFTTSNSFTFRFRDFTWGPWQPLSSSQSSNLIPGLIKTQKFLLRTLGQIQGLPHVKIYGNEPDLEKLLQPIATKIVQVRWSNPEAFLAQLKNQMLLAGKLCEDAKNQMTVDHDFESYLSAMEHAISFYDASISAVYTVRDGSSFEGLVRQGGNVFMDNVAETFFEILRSFAKDLVGAVPNDDAGDIAGYLKVATLIGSQFEPFGQHVKWIVEFHTWQIPEEDMPELNFHLAKGLRLTEREELQELAVQLSHDAANSVIQRTPEFERYIDEVAECYRWGDIISERNTPRQRRERMMQNKKPLFQLTQTLDADLTPQHRITVILKAMAHLPPAVVREAAVQFPTQVLQRFQEHLIEAAGQTSGALERKHIDYMIEDILQPPR
jgi:hypothetical protein